MRRNGTGISWASIAVGAMALLLAATPAIAADMPKRLRAMTPQDFSSAVAVSNDPASGQTILSTEPAFVRNPLSPIRHLLSDNHLRAVVDRESGAVRYEVHQSIFYWGQRRTFTAAHIPAANGTRATALSRADHGERFCPNEDNWGHCALTKKIAFAIDEDELRTIAALYRQGSGNGWAYRVEESGGRHWEDTISPAEAAGLLIAIERLRTSA